MLGPVSFRSMLMGFRDLLCRIDLDSVSGARLWKAKSTMTQDWPDGGLEVLLFCHPEVISY